MIHVAMPVTSDHGWGIVGKYLAQELDRLVGVRLCTPPLTPDMVNDELELDALRRLQIDPAEEAAIKQRQGLVEGGLLTGVVYTTLLPGWPRIHSTQTVGYTCFEEPLAPEAADNARRLYRHLATTSTWCAERLRGIGLTEVTAVPVGIDPTIFEPSPIERQFLRDRFVVFSGGKFEFRKGQDVVIRAVQVLMDKHPDVVLVASWGNKWSHALETINASRHIRFEPRHRDQLALFEQVLADNGVAPSRAILLTLRPQAMMPRVYKNTDVGLFPNRCEGATNQVLMEYMACGRPAIATNTSGHRDLLSEANCLRLEQLRPVEITKNGDYLATWDDPDLDEVIAQLEFAYENRDRLKAVGEQAGQDLRSFTWRHTALGFAELFRKLGLA
jgi:glycosyltransferase involved in cell wall biosynthesis